MALVGSVSNFTGSGSASTGSFGRIEVLSTISGSVTGSIRVGRATVKTLSVGTTLYTSITSGQDGAQGSQGAGGAQGSQGGQGSAGQTGHAGAQGSQGPGGSAGQTGHQGASGAQGSQGGQGPSGNQGHQGAGGAQGSQGGQGPGGGGGGGGGTGHQGATGPGGAQGSQGGTGGTGGGGGTGAGGIFPSTGGTYTVRKLLVVNPPQPAYNPFADPFVGRYWDGTGTNFIFRCSSFNNPAVAYWGGNGGGQAQAYWGNTYGTLLFRFNANGTGQFINTSDRKSKKNILPYSGSAGLSSGPISTALSPVTDTVVSMSEHLKQFRYIQNEPTQSHFTKGFVAQEIEASGSADMKDFIHSSKGDKTAHTFEDFYSLDYNGVSVVTSKALADIDARLTTLETEVTALENA